MPYSLVVTDLQSRARAFPSDWESIKITRRIGGYCEGTFKLDIYDKYAAEILIGQRGVKFYRSSDTLGGASVLRLSGVIWEPLQISPDGINVVVRDPYAYYPWRRNRAQITYTATDASAIVAARIALQNALSPTLLRIGAVQTSVNRTISYLPGKREDEIIEELAGMSSGFFFIINPVDGVPGVFSEMVINYPNAGVTREACRFEYGANTRDNLSDYKVTYSMPKNRDTASSSSSTGGRITSPYEDVVSQATYNLLEDEITVSDISDTTILNAFAQAEVRAKPPVTYTLKPNKNSPLLFQDFDVGDFCRLVIQDGPPGDSRVVDIYEWVRVIEATLVADRNGPEYMEAITVESLLGGKPLVTPEKAFRDYIDGNRARLESLERKVQVLNVAVVAPSGTGAGVAPPPDPTYVPPPSTPPSAPPPPVSPSTPPSIQGVSANGYWYASASPGGTVSITATSSGSTATVTCQLSPSGQIASATIPGDGNPHAVSFDFTGLGRNTSYSVLVNCGNASGNATAGTSFTTPNIQAL